MTNHFKVHEVDRDETTPRGDGYGRGTPYIIFNAEITDTLPTNDPCEIQELAVDAVIEEAPEHAFAESKWIDDRTVEVIIFAS